MTINTFQLHLRCICVPNLVNKKLHPFILYKPTSPVCFPTKLSGKVVIYDSIFLDFFYND